MAGRWGPQLLCAKVPSKIIIHFLDTATNRVCAGQAGAAQSGVQAAYTDVWHSLVHVCQQRSKHIPYMAHAPCMYPTALFVPGAGSWRCANCGLTGLAPYYLWHASVVQEWLPAGRQLVLA